MGLLPPNFFRDIGLICNRHNETLPQFFLKNVGLGPLGRLLGKFLQDKALTRRTCLFSIPVMKIGRKLISRQANVPEKQFCHRLLYDSCSVGPSVNF
jgi:hypothetical protein